jgi:spore coat protein U-like protein
MRKHTLALALGLSAALLTAPVFAATVAGNLTVTATVVASCVVNTAAANAGNAVLDFGNVVSTLADVDADTSTNSGLSLICTNTTPYSVVANNGENDVSGQRRMTSGSGFLAYNLYTDNGRTTPFPTTGTTLSFTGNGATQTVPVYGRIPAGTPMPTPGSYLDHVVMTVTY